MIKDLDPTRIDKVPPRDGFGMGLVECGKLSSEAVVIGADISASTRVDWFQHEFPDRFYNVGIAEQNQMNIAAGLSLVGKIPFVCTYSVFVTGRAWDQVRTTICYNNLNVKIGGAHSGISVGPDGATHQGLEDIALMRCLPNMTVIAPADYLETQKAVIQSLSISGPVYIRFGREKTPVISEPSSEFEIGKAICCRRGKDITLIACGPMVYESLIAAQKLEKEGISAEVINNHTIKPLDKEKILQSARKTGKVVSIEEHQVMGGMGSAVAEFLSESHPVPMRIIGIHDRFGESGPADTLMKEFGLTSDAIVLKAKELFK